MEEKGVYLAIQTPRQVRKKPMYKNGMYRETDKMSDLICENYPMVLVMSRFGIALGFGEKNIGEVCRQNGVDACSSRNSLVSPNSVMFFAENRRFNTFNISLSSNGGKKRKMNLFCSETSGSQR